MSRDLKGRYSRKYQGFIPLWVGYLFLAAILGGLLVNSYLKARQMPLISPLSLEPAPVYAKEKFIVSCEDPKGYLECQVYKGIITWDQHDKISKIIQCESNWNPNAINTKNSNGTWDGGLVQINSIHKNISNADKFDFKKSIDWMIAKIKRDKGYSAWSCARRLGIK